MLNKLSNNETTVKQNLIVGLNKNYVSVLRKYVSENNDVIMNKFRPIPNQKSLNICTQIIEESF